MRCIPGWLVLLLIMNLLSSNVFAQEQAKPIVLFKGKSRTTGTQLWQTDNTTEGTKIFSILTKTPNADTTINPLGYLGNIAIFSAYSAETGQELWRSDGTPAGTFLLKDINAGSASSLYDESSFRLTPAEPLGKSLVFWSIDKHLKALTITDGTNAGTQVLKHFTPIEPDRFVDFDRLYSFKDQIVFWHRTHNTMELWGTDGSVQGTKLIKDFPRVAYGMNDQMLSVYVLDDRLLFWVDDGQHGIQLWQSDGTAAGTNWVTDQPQGDPTALTIPKSILQTTHAIYFINYLASKKLGKSKYLWRLQGKTPEQLYQFPEQGEHELLTATTDEQIFWLSHNKESRLEIWQFNIHTLKAERIYQLPKQKSTHYYQLLNANIFQNKLYLCLDGQQRLLLATDLNTRHTEQLVSNAPRYGEYRSDPLFFSFANRIYFFIFDGRRPAELWITDGTKTGTKKILSEVHQTFENPTEVWQENDLPYRLIDDKLSFVTYSPKSVSGNRTDFSLLWSLSPDQPEKPILLGEFEDAFPLNRPKHEKSSLLHFISKNEQWQTDGTVAGTKKLGALPFNPQGYTTFSSLIPLPTKPPTWIGLLNDKQAGLEPYLLQLDPAKDQLLKDINQSFASSELYNLQPVGKGWYFSFKNQLWFTDTKAPPQKVSGLPEFQFRGSVFKQYAVQGESLYYVTQTEDDSSSSLWQVDQGKASFIQAFAKGQLDLYASKTGVYTLHFAENDAYQLQHWQGKTPTSILNDPKPPRSQRFVLDPVENDQGLFYMLEESDFKKSLWFIPSGSQTHQCLVDNVFINSWQAVEKGVLYITSKDSVDSLWYRPTHSKRSQRLLTGPTIQLQKSQQQIYVLEPKAVVDDSQKHQLLRFDAEQIKLVAIKQLPLLDYSLRIASTEQGLYILTDNDKTELWYLADTAKQAVLLKQFTNNDFVIAGDSIKQTYYFEVFPVGSNSDETTDLWMSEGTVASTRLLKQGVEKY